MTFLGWIIFAGEEAAVRCIDIEQHLFSLLIDVKSIPSPNSGRQKRLQAANVEGEGIWSQLRTTSLALLKNSPSSNHFSRMASPNSHRIKRGDDVHFCK